jgi:hypothetical protein
MSGGFWANGHYRRKKFFESYGVADVDFYAFVVRDIEERPTVWQRVVMALQGWWWYDGPVPTAGDNQVKPK